MICLHTALPSEAKPLLRHFGLRGEPTPGPFPCYVDDDVALVVSGIGKAQAGAACAYLYAQLQHHARVSAAALASAAWINVGIAGHGTHPIGQAVLAHEVLDRASGRRHYPPLVIQPPCPTDLVITVDQVEQAYDPPVAYDMEAAAFCAVASRLAHAELVHCLKVVSDGPEAEVHGITRQKVEGWIGDQLDTLDALIEQCRPLMAEMEPLHADPADFQECLERWHFTATDRRQLRKLLRRRQVLMAGESLPLDGVEASARGREVNRVLGAWLDEWV